MIAKRNHTMEDFVQERVGQTIGGRWVLRSVLGVGGMAAVYAATDVAGNEAAVKILHPEIGMRRDLRDRFMREGTVANRIQHPGVVRVLEHGAVDDRSAFLVLERLHGESLGDRVARQGTLPLPDLLDVLDQVLDVLSLAHDAGVIHRDLKPDNLFLTDDGGVKVLDFGIARVLESAPDDLRTRTGMAMGTLPYMAPEQALGRRSEMDGRVDIFALGATAFRILARRRVHEADSEAGLLLAMASKAAPPIRSVAEHVPENVANIIDVALAFDRDARYPDARTMQRDVRAVQRAESPPFAGAKQRAREEATRVPLPVPAPVSLEAPLMPADSHASPTVNARSPAAVHVSPVLLPLYALGCLLLGAFLWVVWHRAQPAPELTDAERRGDESAQATTGEQQLDREISKKSEQDAREHAKKQQEVAREQQKKLEEFKRERAKKEAERRREKEKR